MENKLIEIKQFSHKSLDVAIIYLVTQEIITNPEVSNIIFTYNNPLFVPQIFNEAILHLKTEGKSYLDRSLKHSKLKKISIKYIDEKNRVDEIIVWNKITKNKTVPSASLS